MSIFANPDEVFMFDKFRDSIIVDRPFIRGRRDED